jgi:hypothetical protein
VMRRFLIVLDALGWLALLAGTLSILLDVL